MLFPNTAVALSLSLSLAWITGCESHGLVEFPASRNQFCGVITKPENIFNPLETTREECFDAFAFGNSNEDAYRFMAVLSNGPGRIGDNPLPNNVCGYGSSQFENGITPWDAYSVDWPTNDITSGRQEFRWNILWGSHFTDTMEFRHWITTEDFVYDRDRPLNWGDFEDAPFCTLNYDDATPNANPNVIPLKDEAKFRTYCDIPERSGRHVIYAEWGRRPPSSDERFHGCIDVEFNGEGPTPTTPSPVSTPTTPAPIAAGTPAPVVSPTNPPVAPTNPPVAPTNPPVAEPTLPPVSTSADCEITIQPGQNAWFAGLEIGFDSPSITLDFSATGLDLSQVQPQQGVFNGMTVSGSLITLTKPAWVSKTNKGFMGFNGSNVAALATLTPPVCV